MNQALFSQQHTGYAGKILMIVSNPTVSKQTGWAVGVWYSEVTHPYWVFSEAGYQVDLASPEGGKIEFDGYSDPEHESGYAKDDYVSLGFKKDKDKMALTENTLKLSSVNPNDYKAIFVCGGQAPMYTMVNNAELHKFFANFYETGKPTAAICHGTSILLNTKLSNGKYLVEGKRWTGFSSSEEQYVDNYVGMKVQPFRIEDEARKITNTFYTSGKPFGSFALEDGNLITGQQQNSGVAAARLVLKQLEAQKERYPTIVLVHGAWADESAWGFVRSKLAVNANVEVVNLPGHGVDLTPISKITLKDYTDRVEQEIKKHPGKVILVGHSMSGMVVTQVAENVPEKIEKLVYVAAYLPQNGQSLMDLALTDTETMLTEVQQYNSVKGEARMEYQRKVIVPAICADCPDFMKEIIVKYYSEEPLAPFQEKVALSKGRFGSVPKYYIYATKDRAVGYQLQKKMVAANGSIKRTYEMPTSHLPFVVNPDEFVRIIGVIRTEKVK
ncbi:MAG: alpha/beta fold hydrolase [Sphingobacteriia bacterium]